MVLVEPDVGTKGPAFARELVASGVGLVILTAFAGMVGFGIVAPILPLYARSFGVGYGAAGLLISVYGAARLVCDPFAGMLADRYGERLMAATGIGIMAGSSVFVALAPNFAVAVAFRGMTGAGAAVMFSAMYSYMMKVLPEDRMARTFGVFFSAFNVGYIAGGPLGGFVAEAWGLAAPLLFYAGLQAVSGVLFWRYVPPVPVHPRASTPAAADEPTAGARGRARRLAGLVRTPGMKTALLLNFSYMWIYAGAFSTLVPLFGRDGLGMSTVAISTGFAAVVVTELAVMYPAGSLADRIGRRPVLVPGFLGLVVLIVALGWAGSPLVLYGLLAEFGIVSGIASVIPTAIFSDVTPPGRKGPAIGLYRFCGDLGFALGPVIVGAMVVPLGFKGAFAVAAVPVGIALLVAARTGETLAARRTEPSVNQRAAMSTLAVGD